MQRILLVEDHASFRQTLAFVFDQEPEFEVVAQAGTLAEARQVMDGSEADLGVIDLALPDGEGTESDRRTARSQPGLRGARPDREPGEDRARQGGRGRGGRHPAQVSRCRRDTRCHATSRRRRDPALRGRADRASPPGRTEPRRRGRSAREHRADHTPRKGSPADARRGPLEQGDSGQTAHERGYGAHPHDEHT